MVSYFIISFTFLLNSIKHSVVYQTGIYFDTYGSVPANQIAEFSQYTITIIIFLFHDSSTYVYSVSLDFINSVTKFSLF